MVKWFYWCPMGHTKAKQLHAVDCISIKNVVPGGSNYEYRYISKVNTDTRIETYGRLMIYKCNTCKNLFIRMKDKSFRKLG